MEAISRHKSAITSLSSLLFKLFRHIKRHRRYQFVLMFGLTLMSSIAEVISLGSVLPFIGILTQPEKVFNSLVLGRFIKALGVISPADLILPLTIAFIVAALAAGGLRLLLLKMSIRFANAVGADLSVEVYRRTLYQPYSIHVSRSSSKIISGITQKVRVVTTLLTSAVSIVTLSFLFIAILLTLVAINPFVATISTLGFGIAYGLITWKTRHQLIVNSQCITEEQTQEVKALQEGLGAIRDVLLDGTQAVYCDVYQKAIQQLRRAEGENTYINQAPRYSMEALGMVLIAVIAFVLSHQPGGIGAAMPILAALALGAQRLLPLLQQLYSNWSIITGSHAALVDVLSLLDQPLSIDAALSTPAPLLFRKTITFDNIRFKYNINTPYVLDGINLTIQKGTRVGFIGSTGSGKSTALDLLMSLLVPTEGQLLVDDQPLIGQLRSAWQRIVAHVPQNIYLADATMIENIAFGMPPDKIDLDRVRQAARQAQIAEFIESHPENYNLFVGERGVRLSGGQRQRIGIARALYKQATVLVFDEATSALDSITEKGVMSSIENLNRDLTILIIAHRLTTLQNCDTIVKLENGKIVEQGSYEYFMNRNFDYHVLSTTA